MVFHSQGDLYCEEEEGWESLEWRLKEFRLYPVGTGESQTVSREAKWPSG